MLKSGEERIINRIVLLSILSILFFTEVATSQTFSDKAKGRLSKFEKIYNITPKGDNEPTRLKKLEMKSIGLNNKGTVDERLDQVEKTYNDQMNNCIKPAVEPIYEPVIEKPVKNKNNPVQHDYQPESGNYFETITKAIESQNYKLKDYHFKKFPVKYYIEPSNPEWDQQIRQSLKIYKKVIPVREVTDKKKADINIQVVDGDKIFSISGEKDRPGLNRTAIKTENNKVIEFKSDIFINQKNFKYPMSIYSSSTINHEFLHALGLTGHSNSMYDILYPRTDVNVLYGAKVGLIRETCQLKDFDQFAQLSPRDLNTLWLLYNEW